MMGHFHRTVSLVAVVLVFLSAPGAKLFAQESTAARIVDSIDEGQLVTLNGNIVPWARHAHDLGRVSPDLPMGDLVLVLRRSPQQQAAFDALVAGQYATGSPSYHQWLTAAQVGEHFGPAAADLSRISDWLGNHGFTVDEVSPDRLSIRFSGSAFQVESTFHTEIHNLEVRLPRSAASALAETESHIANVSDPQIPAALAPVVVGVKALHNFFPRPLHRLGSRVSLDQASGFRQRVGSVPVVPTKTPGLSAPTGMRPQFGTIDGYGNTIEDVAPYDFATIYNVLRLWKAATPIDGTGQTIAIAGTSNINLADVAAFRAAFGLPAKVPTVVITNNDPGDCPGFDSSCSSDLIENTLDVEWSGAVAKGATITLVTSSAPTPSTDPLYLSESYIVQHKTAPVMNVSYGECELLLGNAGNTLYNNLWQTAASEGIAVFVASGDAGSPSCDQGFDAQDGVPYGAQFGLSVSGIASTVFDTAVGGTDFNWGSSPAPYWSATNTSGTEASALGYIPEVPWNSTCTNPLVLPELEADAAYVGVTGVDDAESGCNFVLDSGPTILADYGTNLAPLVDTIGSGGGASNCTTSNGPDPLSCSGGWPKPSWQANVPGIIGDGLRDIPDVSFFASNGFLGSSYLICVSGGGSACTYSATSEPTAQEVGGTSVASPAMAGVMALINQKSASAQGNPNVLLYKLAGEQSWGSCSSASVTNASSCVFNDINTGTNAMPCESGSPNCSVIYNGDEAGVLPGYSAGTGYDAATGLGSLNVANLVNLWPASTTLPAVSLSPGSIAFGNQTVGVASAPQVVTLKNTGGGSLTFTGALTGTNAAAFSKYSNCTGTLAAGASCTINISFKPSAAGAASAALTLTDNAFGSPQSVPLSATGVAPAPVATLSYTQLGFSATNVGSTSTAPLLTLKNSGTGTLDISSIAITGADPTSYSETNTCASTLAVGASCSITIVFKPQTGGTLTASLAVTDNAAASPQSVAISGSGVSGATVTLSPTSVAFGSQAVGASSAAKAVTLTNSGTATLTYSGAFTGTNAAEFTKYSNCTGTLAASASCTIDISFKPTAAGAATAALTFTDNAGNSPQSVALAGTGTTAAAVTLSPTSIGFGNQATGTTSAVHAVTLTNSGAATLTYSGAFTGTNAGEFTKYSNCTGTLAAGASCTIDIEFAPTAAGAATAALTLTDNAGNSPQSVALTGTGLVATTVTISPTSVAFGTQATGTTSAAHPVTLTNSGAAALTFSGAFTGANAAEFAKYSNCTGTLAAGASCTIDIEFAPTAAGAATAALTLTDNAASSPQSISLTGTGQQP